KQAFVQDLLAVSFNPTAFNQNAFNQFGSFPLPTIGQAVAANAGIPGAQPLNLFRDFSTSQFAATSLGYRLFGEWGKRETGLVTAGTDMRILGQGLQENIVFDQLSGRNLNTGALIGARDPRTGLLLPGAEVPRFNQNQSIPDSNWVNPGLFLAAE